MGKRKYFVKVNQRWEYDDLVEEEILVFSSPVSFYFTNADIIKNVLKKLGYEKLEIIETTLRDNNNNIVRAVKGKNPRYWDEVYDLSNFLDYDNDIRKKILEILEKEYDVILLKTEQI